ncbi:hypothetical protein VPH35_123478 [Triticum aestivum]
MPADLALHRRPPSLQHRRALSALFFFWFFRSDRLCHSSRSRPPSQARAPPSLPPPPPNQTRVGLAREHGVAHGPQPRSNMSTLALRRNQEPHDCFPFFSSLPSVSGQAARRETAMAARCPSATGQGPAGVQTPSTPSPSRWRPAPNPIQHRATLRSPPRSSAA